MYEIHLYNGNVRTDTIPHNELQVALDAAKDYVNSGLATESHVVNTEDINAPIFIFKSKR